MAPLCWGQRCMTSGETSTLNEGYYSYRMGLWPTDRKIFAMGNLWPSALLKFTVARLFLKKDSLKSQKGWVFFFKEYLQFQSDAFKIWFGESVLSTLQLIQAVHILLLCGYLCGHTQEREDNDFPSNGHPTVFCNIASQKPMEYGLCCSAEWLITG